MAKIMELLATANELDGRTPYLPGLQNTCRMIPPGGTPCIRKGPFKTDKAIHIVYIIHQEGLGSNAQAFLIGS